jgi:hypothetical protein
MFRGDLAFLAAQAADLHGVLHEVRRKSRDPIKQTGSLISSQDG